MARQLGAIKYSGTIGDIRHFKIKGLSGHYAGLKGGATGEQIKNDPGFVRTRENMNEFGACAQAGRSVRVGLNALMKQMSDSQLTGRLTGIMKKINLEDQSEARGYRAILISEQGKYLEGLHFNKNFSLDRVLLAPFDLSTNGVSSTLGLAPFNPVNSIIAPAGATHFRIINALSVVSDFAYNSTTGIYEAIEPGLNEVSNIAYSDYQDLRTELYAAVVIESVLPNNVQLNSNVCVLNSIGIEFYQKAGNEYYLLNSGHALKIQKTYTEQPLA